MRFENIAHYQIKATIFQLSYFKGFDDKIYSLHTFATIIIFESNSVDANVNASPFGIFINIMVLHVAVIYIVISLDILFDFSFQCEIKIGYTYINITRNFAEHNQILGYVTSSQLHNFVTMGPIRYHAVRIQDCYHKTNKSVFPIKMDKAGGHLSPYGLFFKLNNGNIF